MKKLTKINFKVLSYLKSDKIEYMLLGTNVTNNKPITLCL